MALGIATAVVFQARRGVESRSWVGAGAPETTAEPRPDAKDEAPALRVAPERLARWEAESRTLTPVTVALDEDATQRWLVRLPELESALANPRVRDDERSRLARVHARLVESGVISAPSEFDDGAAVLVHTAPSVALPARMSH